MFLFMVLVGLMSFNLQAGVQRKADHPIDKQFLNRWSPRAMSGQAVSDAELMTIFEAARWAPSEYNIQPWRLIYAKRGTKHWQNFLNLLVENNRKWAQHAGALVIIASQSSNAGNPIRTHSFDTGAAWENLALQGTMNGLVVHGIGGFDYAAAAKLACLPENYTVEAMIVIGKPGPVEVLPERMRAFERPSGRKPLSEIVFEGAFKQ